METEQLPEIAAILEAMRRVAAAQREELGPRTYSYFRLSDEAKEKVRERFREYYRDDNFVTEEITDAFNYRLSDLGYQGEYEGPGGKNPEGLEVPWRLGYCQGDGVAFEGSPDDLEKVVKRVLPRRDFRLLNYRHRSGDLAGDRILDYVSVRVLDTNHHYHHWNSFEVEVDTEGLYHTELTERQTAVITLLQESIQEELVALSHEFEALGYKIMEECDGDDYIDDLLVNCWEDRLYYVNGEEAK